ncbi:FAD-dependent oxidoreductase [Paraglaciecola aquimarina]|uniref:FAD-dependent oxidoreductase n=1 Tax=Paraglaciecola aquimarina TaxID=1235557 RepID=A0ABU3SUT3_9ALTE|nr:FAD-dependent oxidoreductase [Paraglaciecola aquimarina]MDU0353776.1 FAD-dependent oxidoreductase [Paraglaciecola aquimarina]
MENIHLAPTIFHAHFDEVYQIPFRSLYSKNVPNLLFAGRNVSQTHIALASSRIMATCALMGQAVGTAGHLCVEKNVLPRKIYQSHMNELQEQLLRDDMFIPKRPAKDPADLARKAAALVASSTQSGDVNLLTNGWSRDIDGKVHHWQSKGLPADVQLEWLDPVNISQLEIKCDTNVKRNIMMRKDSKDDELYANSVPQEMLKSLRVEARVNGRWLTVGKITHNRSRLIKVKFAAIKTSAIKISVLETYGKPSAKLFEIRAYA